MVTDQDIAFLVERRFMNSNRISADVVEATIENN